MREKAVKEEGKQTSVGVRERPRPESRAARSPDARGAVASLLGLQRARGNRYVQRLISRADDAATQGPLIVGEAGDQHEREADHVAESVAQTGEAEAVAGAGTAIQRKAAPDSPSSASPSEKRIEFEDDVVAFSKDDKKRWAD